MAYTHILAYLRTKSTWFEFEVMDGLSSTLNELADTCVSIEFERNLSMAEREGFEPSLGVTLLTV